MQNPPILLAAVLILTTQLPIFAQDTTAPTVTNVVLSSNDMPNFTSDVTDGDDPVSVKIDFLDDDSGVNGGQLTFFRPDGVVGFIAEIDASHLGCGPHLSDNPQGGCYSVPVTIPQYAQWGTWRYEIILRDLAGNDVTYTNDTSTLNNPPSCCNYQPYPSSPAQGNFVVSNNTFQTDDTAPLVTSAIVTPNTIDTQSNTANISVQLEFADDLSGVREFSVIFRGLSNELLDEVDVDLATPTTSGSHTVNATIPAGTPEGDYVITVLIFDRLGNFRLYWPGLSGDFSDPTHGRYSIVYETSTYGFFADLYGLVGDDALPNANPDGDPYSNLFELVFGLNPAVADLHDPSVLSLMKDGDDFELVFTISSEFTITASGDFLHLTNGEGDGLWITGETTQNLSHNWAKQLPSKVTGRMYCVSLPISANSTGFARLNVETEMP